MSHDLWEVYDMTPLECMQRYTGNFYFSTVYLTGKLTHYLLPFLLWFAFASGRLRDCLEAGRRWRNVDLYNLARLFLVTFTFYRFFKFTFIGTK